MIARDITERERKEKELRESRKEYLDLFDSLNEAVFVHDLQGNFLAVNDTAVKRLGYSERELLSMRPHDIDAPEYVGKIEERTRRLEEDETLVFESAHITKDGERIPVEINSSIITFKGEPAILSTARDIRGRKRREAEDLRRNIVHGTMESIAGDVTREFGVEVSAREIGVRISSTDMVLPDMLTHLSELKTVPEPRSIFDFIVDGIRTTLEEKGVDAPREEIREVLDPNICSFLQEIFDLAEVFRIEVPFEYEELRKELAED